MPPMPHEGTMHAVFCDIFRSFVYASRFAFYVKIMPDVHKFLIENS